MVRVASKGKQHIYYQDLHAKYGDVVRIGQWSKTLFIPSENELVTLFVGPNELSIRNVDAVQAVLGTKGLPKGPCKFFVPHSLNHTFTTDRNIQSGIIESHLKG